MPQLYLFRKLKNLYMILYFYLCSLWRPRKCKRVFQITDAISAVSDGVHIHFEEPTRSRGHDVHISAYSGSSGDKGRLWCRSVGSAINSAAHSITPCKLGVDYVKIYHKSGLKLFAPKDKYIPLHLFSRYNVFENQ